MDIGIYCLYPAVTLFGEPKQVSSYKFICLSQVLILQDSILLTYDEMDAVIMYSKISSSYVPSEIQGENGSMIIDKMNTPESVTIYYRDGTVEDITRSQDADDMYYEAKEFVNLVTNKKQRSELNSHQNTLITAKIIEDARNQVGLVYPADK